MPRRVAPRKHRIGRKTARVEIQEQQGTTANAYGEVGPEWVTVATRWAMVETLSGRELYFARQSAAVATHRVEMWHVPGLNPGHRLKLGDLILHIEFVNDNEETEAFCVEQVDTTTTV